MTARALIAVAALAAAVAGCGEAPQTAGTSKKTDAKGWDTASTGLLAEGWKGGDQAAWEAQLRARAQKQNEYLRIGSQAAAAKAKAP